MGTRECCHYLLLLPSLRPAAAAAELPPVAAAAATAAAAAVMTYRFWDMETWMYPNLLFFHQQLATGTVMYRVNGLSWAEKWAVNTSRMGARYPWQTATSGKVASHANEEEIHIVGDVALSMWQYYAATHNTTWLKAHGLPVLAATAQFFADWASENPDGTFSLNHTQGPDEFHTGDDSCYVNAAAALNLRSAANFSAMLKQPYPSNWTTIADKVRLPFDSSRQLHLEFAEWNDNDKAKQADTVMLSYPLGVEMSPTVRKNDLDYYANHTGNGPSMTWSMFAVGYLEIGELEQAASFFNRSWLPYVDRKTGDFGGDCGGNFLTGAGGFLQGLWAGWAGMRIRLDSLDFITPRVPATTDGLKLRGVTYLNSKFDLDLSNGQACFHAWHGASLKIGILGAGSFAPLSPTKATCYKLGASMRIVGQ
jgi:trehalose/maltose hydrolase-like predicted phosphorylase